MTTLGISKEPFSDKRKRGAFYTPPSAADFMAAWTLDGNPKTVLEPCFGEGTFIKAIKNVSATLGRIPPKVIGVEIDENVFDCVTSSGIIFHSDAIKSDFLRVSPMLVDAVIGNPPYVRLRNMEDSESKTATNVMERLGIKMDPSGSVWMPFVAHCVSFLRRGGRLALVIPFDATYVRYARPLWGYLASQFGDLQVVRSQERVFSDLLQDVVILLASDKGESCEVVRYSAYSDLENFLSGAAEVEASIPVADIVGGRRPFTWAHIEPELRDLLNNSAMSSFIPSKKLARFNIGYVAGDKNFFHPSPDIQSEFGLRGKSLIKTLRSSRKLRGAGLYTSRMPDDAIDRLFFPVERGSGAAESDLRYVQHGEELGVDQRYKCRKRSPWYIVPYVKRPDVILSVFAERPILAVNDASLVASNSLLCGYLNGMDASEFAARWYTSITLLYIEAEVHSLGGGVMVLVPRETGNVNIANHEGATESRLAEIDLCLKRGDVEGAYRVGDQSILKDCLGLTDRDLDMVYDGIAKLTRWRTSAQTSNGSK